MVMKCQVLNKHQCQDCDVHVTEMYKYISDKTVVLNHHISVLIVQVLVFLLNR